jgi:hypothetical protein
MYVSFDGNTVWVIQDKMAELIQRDRNTIVGHVKNIIEIGDLIEDDVMTKVGNPDFSRKRQIQLYNLQMILDGGYRIVVFNSVSWQVPFLMSIWRKVLL